MKDYWQPCRDESLASDTLIHEVADSNLKLAQDMDKSLFMLPMGFNKRRNFIPVNDIKAGYQALCAPEH